MAHLDVQFNATRSLIALRCDVSFLSMSWNEMRSNRAATCPGIELSLTLDALNRRDVSLSEMCSALYML
jgi:hypothetical protein